MRHIGLIIVKRLLDLIVHKCLPTFRTFMDGLKYTRNTLNFLDHFDHLRLKSVVLEGGTFLLGQARKQR